MMGFLKYTTLFFMLTYHQTVAQQVKGYSLKWSIAAKIPPGVNQLQNLGFAGPICGLSNQHLIVAGGANFPDKMPWMGGEKKYHDEIYVYAKKEHQILLKETNSKLPVPIAYPAVCTLPNGVLYAGGENAIGLSSQVFLLKWNDRNNIVQSIEFPSLPFAVSNASSVYLENNIYLVGGETNQGVSDKIISLNLNDLKSGWQTIASLPFPISHSVLLGSNKNGKKLLYIAGGRNKTSSGVSDLYDSFFSFDIATLSITKKSNIPSTLSASTGAIMDDAFILLFGGDSGETFHKVETLIAAIKNERDPIVKDSLLNLKNNIQEKHPGFRNDVFRYNILTDKWDIIGKIPFPTPVTTTAVNWGHEIYILSGEIKAGVRSPNILLAQSIYLPND